MPAWWALVIQACSRRKERKRERLGDACSTKMFLVMLLCMLACFIRPASSLVLAPRSHALDESDRGAFSDKNGLWLFSGRYWNSKMIFDAHRGAVPLSWQLGYGFFSCLHQVLTLIVTFFSSRICQAGRNLVIHSMSLEGLAPPNGYVEWNGNYISHRPRIPEAAAAATHAHKFRVREPFLRPDGGNGPSASHTHTGPP